LWTKQEPTAKGQQLMMRQEVCLPTIFVQSIVKMNFFLVPCSLILIYDQPGHDVNVLGLRHDNCYPFFVEIILTPARELIVITQSLELPEVCFA
jgi:hypothetical protein